jgi:hypothetical protein
MQSPSPDCNGKLFLKKQISFVGFTKRPEEALGKAYKTFVFQKNLEWKAGIAS